MLMATHNAEGKLLMHFLYKSAVYPVQSLSNVKGYGTPNVLRFIRLLVVVGTEGYPKFRTATGLPSRAARCT